MSKVIGTGVPQAQVSLTRQEPIILTHTSKHKTNGGMVIKDSPQLSSMISILTASRTTLKYGQISIAAQGKSRVVRCLFSTRL